jgi:hypothetical protein
MATIPATQSFLANEKVTAAKLIAATKTPLDFLLNPPRCSVAYKAGDISGDTIATGTATLIPFGTEGWDTDSMHSTSTNASRVVFNTVGLYQVSVFARFAPNATGYRMLNVRLNAGGNSGFGSTLTTFAQPAAPSTTSTSISRTLDLNVTSAGDYIELFLTQTSGATLGVETGERVTGFHVRWVGTNNTA